MKYKLVIFDLDGTILDTLDDLADSLNFALSSVGYPVRSSDEVRRMVGNGIRRLIERALPQECPTDLTDRVFDAFKRYYKDHCALKTAPYEGIPELLGELKASGMKLALLSNKADFAVQSLCAHYFGGLFDLALGEREGIRRKPAPDAVNEVLGHFGIDRSSAVYVGDSEVDVETAKNAAIDCIAVDWGFRDRADLRSQGADRIVSSADELRRLLTE